MLKPADEIEFMLYPVYPNMQQLEFDLSQEGLYISETSRLDLSIIDADEDGTGQDLARGYSELWITRKLSLQKLTW